MRVQYKILRLFTAFTIIGFLAFTGLQLAKNLSPQETVSGIYNFIHNKIADKGDPTYLFHDGNKGLYEQLNKVDDKLKHIEPNDIVRVFGVHSLKNVKSPVKFEITDTRAFEGIYYNEGLFFSYDSVGIPFYEILPTVLI